MIDAQGDKHRYGYSESGLSTFGELGLTRRLSLGWVWGFLKKVESDSADAFGTLDPEVSLGWHLYRRGSWSFSLQTTGVLPLGPENPAAAPGYAPPFFSHGAYALEFKPQAGWSGRGWWVQGGAGIRARSHGHAWQFRYSTAGGRNLGSRLAALVALDGAVPLDFEGSGIPGDQENYYGYHIGMDFRLLPSWRIGAQFDSMITLGQELPLGARLNLVTSLAWD